jgi:hypothetical protein
METRRTILMCAGDGSESAAALAENPRYAELFKVLREGAVKAHKQKRTKTAKPKARRHA